METPPRKKSSRLMEDMIDAVRAKLGPWDRETLIRTIGYCRSVETAVQRCRELLGQHAEMAPPATAGYPWARPAGFAQPPTPALTSELAPDSDDGVTLVRAHLRRKTHRSRPADSRPADRPAGPPMPPRPATETAVDAEADRMPISYV